MKKPKKRKCKFVLTRYREFARHFLAFGTPTFQNITASMIACGYSEKYADQYGYIYVDRPGVQAELARIREARLKRSTIASPEEVLETVTMVMRAQPSEFMDENGALKSLNKLPRGASQLLAGFKFKTRTYVQGRGEDATPVTEETVEYKLTDRLKAADMIAKHHGLYEADNKQKGDGKPALLVAYPTGNITIEEWQSQVITIMQQAHGAQVDPVPALPAPAGA